MQQQLENAPGVRRLRLQLLREQPSLPETAEELESLANILVANPHEDLLLREKATERQVKSAMLNQYNILSFATHGLLAVELKRGVEPGLVLTPPLKATAEDDGFLSLSEVARLRLNADWVILSACNTAGADSVDAEGMSGLAKAFTYAGAKALLMSHWAVSSRATVELMERLFKEYQSRQLPKAEAHRQAMLQMIGSGAPLLRHPSMWAPFVVVAD